jgi:RibD C-terminal domain
MSNVLWHTQMSLDGFIAGPGDAMEWAFEDWGVADEPDETIAEVVRSAGALLVGRRTQDVEDRDAAGVLRRRLSRPVLHPAAQPAPGPPCGQGRPRPVHRRRDR